ncbi:helix-turn-helix domain-containing protein [Flavobacterium sp. Sd200]|uniref:helix-turn-helix domain-containing protein n=1 Tax=Flavobacterium sp. Sd200 TaxID=2692211 RepID=UPI00136D34A5|nr:helix-turn-helix domain-containing protein [Flavobacterium sp. Sd200]MXN90234.1 helix-turn-helix domain-containing protein [Flavobacterium sp. Sd200]
MKKIATYSIQQHQKVFNLSSNKKDFFYVELGKGSLFNPEPRRSETYALCFLKQGEILLQTGLQKQTVKAPSLIALGPTVVRSMHETENQPYMDIIFFTGNYLLEKRSNVFYLMEFDFFEDNDLHTSHLNPIQAKKTARIFNMIKEAVEEHHIHEPEMVRSSIFALIHEMDSFVKNYPAPQSHISEKVSPILGAFKRLLNKEYQQQRFVSFYADKLNVTPKHLSELLKKETGKTAGEWIDEVIVLEARVLLQNKSLSVSQVSEYLNFSDQSVFGKFFKTHTSLTPLQYRKSLL